MVVDDFGLCASYIRIVWPEVAIIVVWLTVFSRVTRSHKSFIRPYSRRDRDEGQVTEKKNKKKKKKRVNGRNDKRAWKIGLMQYDCNRRVDIDFS